MPKVITYDAITAEPIKVRAYRTTDAANAAANRAANSTANLTVVALDTETIGVWEFRREYV